MSECIWNIHTYESSPIPYQCIWLCASLFRANVADKIWNGKSKTVKCSVSDALLKMIRRVVSSDQSYSSLVRDFILRHIENRTIICRMMSYKLLKLITNLCWIEQFTVKLLCSENHWHNKVFVMPFKQDGCFILHGAFYYTLPRHKNAGKSIV